MNPLALKRQFIALAAALAASAAVPQQPLDLNPTFSTNIATFGTEGSQPYVTSLVILPDGDLMISGAIRFTDQWITRGYARLNQNGSRHDPFAEGSPGGGKLTLWNNRLYVGNMGLVRRIDFNGTLDNDFDLGPNLSGLFNPIQGGDYHVYPDGSVVVVGFHTVNDPDHGQVGSRSMIWFQNNGYLDTTKTHRYANSTIYTMAEQPDGKFILSGSATEWDGQPVANTFRVHPDGSLDTTFNAAITWGYLQGITVMDDGRILCSGLVKTEYSSLDTLHVVRLFPDGSFDPTFNNTLIVQSEQFGQFLFLRHTLLPDGRIALNGNFDTVEGHERKGLLVLDDNGFLPEAPLMGSGCGEYEDFTGLMRHGTNGLVISDDGSIYIYGSYLGYDDGTNNYTNQRFVSRLYGLSVGVEEREIQQLQMHPNPAQNAVTITLPERMRKVELIVLDALGQVVYQQRIGSAEQFNLAITGWPTGLYQVQILSDGMRKAAGKLIIE